MLKERKCSTAFKAIITKHQECLNFAEQQRHILWGVRCFKPVVLSIDSNSPGSRTKLFDYSSHKAYSNICIF